jgi:ribonucleotide reductase beta subunit family protein with ferritin-like domain
MSNVNRKIKRLKPKKIFNQNSTEAFNEAKVLGGNPNGIFNFNGTNHKWATDLYKKMEARTWFPGQINITKDTNNYGKLNKAEKRSYDLFLAQLITNDSLQTNQLMDKINSYVTSPIANACLSRQSSEEGTHSFSYAVMAEDIAKDTSRIYNMHLHDDELATKNKAVEDLYSTLYKVYVPDYLIIRKIILDNLDTILDGYEDNTTFTKDEVKDIIDRTIKMVVDHINEQFIDPSPEDVLLAFVANQILEELVFPGGFAGMLSLGNKMPGSAEMISEINFHSLPTEKSVA